MAAPRRTIQRARALRKATTLPERLLWSCLRGSGFRRQHPLGPYILDFYHRPARLCVEVDGWGHSLGDQPLRDLRRDAWLAGKGVRVMRIPAVEVLNDLDDVARRIAWTLSTSPWAQALGEGDHA